MRDFYVNYHDNKRQSPMVAEIGWTHNLIIMSKCKDDLQREFYIRMTKKMGWTKNVLVHHIEYDTYNKTLASQTNFNSKLSPKIRNQAKLALKDEYSFDFLELYPCVSIMWQQHSQIYCNRFTEPCNIREVKLHRTKK